MNITPVCSNECRPLPARTYRRTGGCLERKPAWRAARPRQAVLGLPQDVGILRPGYAGDESGRGAAVLHLAGHRIAWNRGGAGPGGLFDAMRQPVGPCGRSWRLAGRAVARRLERTGDRSGACVYPTRTAQLGRGRMPAHPQCLARMGRGVLASAATNALAPADKHGRRRWASGRALCFTRYPGPPGRYACSPTGASWPRRRLGPGRPARPAVNEPPGRLRGDRHARCRCLRHGRDDPGRGYTLVEALIATLAGSVLLLSVVSVTQGVRATELRMRRESIALREMRQAVTTVRGYLRVAGFSRSWHAAGVAGNGANIQGREAVCGSAGARFPSHGDGRPNAGTPGRQAEQCLATAAPEPLYACIGSRLVDATSRQCRKGPRRGSDSIGMLYVEDKYPITPVQTCAFEVGQHYRGQMVLRTLRSPLSAEYGAPNSGEWKEAKEAFQPLAYGIAQMRVGFNLHGAPLSLRRRRHAIDGRVCDVASIEICLLPEGHAQRSQPSDMHFDCPHEAWLAVVAPRNVGAAARVLDAS